jgi:hypothetical protein
MEVATAVLLEPGSVSSSIEARMVPEKSRQTTTGATAVKQ